MEIRDQMEKIYGETPPADIPWNIESPPKALVESHAANYTLDMTTTERCEEVNCGKP